MLRLLADENFNGRILRALQRQIPDLDVIRVQDTPLYRADDPSVLAWAAEAGRIVLTHDIATLVGYALQRVHAGQAMPGVVVMRSDAQVGRVAEDLQILIETSQPEELEGQVVFLPL